MIRTYNFVTSLTTKQMCRQNNYIFRHMRTRLSYLPRPFWKTVFTVIFQQYERKKIQEKEMRPNSETNPRVQ